MNAKIDDYSSLRQELVMGVIKAYSKRMGYGFIRPDQKRDIYFHITNYWSWESKNEKRPMKRAPKEGDVIMYALEENEKGLFAAYFMFYGEGHENNPRSLEEILSTEYLDIINEIEDKIMFMGKYIILSRRFVDQPTIILATKKFLPCESLEVAIACISWAAANFNNVDPVEAMEEVLNAISEHELNSSIISDVIGCLDKEGSYKNISLKALKEIL